MALRRPEGLSPCYLSLASPDIPESRMFRWTFRGANSSDYQTKYKIIIKDEDKNTVKTYNVTSGDSEVPMDNVGYSFSLGSQYYWTVTVWGKDGTISEESTEAVFVYDSCAAAPAVVWNYIPKPGDVVVADTYFEEMKANIDAIMGDYDGVPSSIRDSVETLFTGEVVPSRDDFVKLEGLIDYLSKTLETSYTIDVDGPVEDSLGVSDLEKIREHLDMLLTVKPKPVQSLKINVPEPTIYEISSFSVISDGKLDPTMDILWDVEDMSSPSGDFTFEKISPSKDVRYYECFYEYGTSNNPFISQIYFKADDINNGTLRRFEANWDGLYTATTLGLAKQQLRVFTVDHRGNKSDQASVVKVFGSNFKAPLGVKEYQVEYQKSPLGDTKGPYPDKAWARVYTGPLKKFTHKITSGGGRVYYRVRAVDLSGLMNDWTYNNGVTFDPLTPPAAPKLKATSTTTTIDLDWEPTARAEWYEWRIWWEGNITRTTTTAAKATGLTPAKEYNLYVRAGNRVGTSSWSSISIKTKTARKTVERAPRGGKSWRDNWGWRTDNNFVYQGEWCEIAGSPHRIKSVPVGYCWGKHKGMWLMDDDYWRATLAGKKIIKTEVWVQRKDFYHGYYDDQNPTFWLHNYDNYPKGQPMFFGKYQPPKEFDLGESSWVTLPNYYGEYIRDGKAKGLGVYRDSWGKLPYIQFYPTAKLRITFE